MATTGPTHQFKVNKMPEELLFQPFPSLNSRQCFRKMEPYEFKFSKSLLSDKSVFHLEHAILVTLISRKL